MRTLASLRALLGGLALAAGLVAPAFAAAPGQPVAPVHPVTDTYFGTPVVDDYRYMEDLDNPEVKAWMRGQADYTRGQLDALPGRGPLLDRVHALLNADLQRGAFIQRGQRLFYKAIQPGAPLPRLYWRDGAHGEEHLLVDPGALGKGTATHYALDFFMPSWDGKRIAYGLSAGGSEKSVLHVMDVQTGAILSEAIDRTSNSRVSWRPDNQSFYYLRYPKPTPDLPPDRTMFNGRTYLHVLGAHADGEGDAAVFGRGVSPGLDVPEGQGTWLVTSPGSKYALAIANHNMDDNPSTVYVAPLAQVKGAGTPWRKIADANDGVTAFHLRGDTLYLLAQKDAPRYRLLSLPLARPVLSRATVVLPEGDGVLTDVEIARDGLYARVRDGAVSHVHRISFDGRLSQPVPLPFEGDVSALVTDEREPGALISLRGWLQSTRTLAYDPARGRADDTGLNPPSSIDTSAYAADEVFAIGDDGTRIPLSILHRKDMVADGSHPTILSGYGAYGISQEPSFVPTNLAWLERGGVLAYAHIRGGGEYGEGWHQAGYKQTKLNTVSDFAACGQYLVDHRVTTSARLAGLGGSAGGITVGGALTRHTALFGVILDLVGMSDTLRAENSPNGPPNIVEFGTVKDEAGFHGLYAMSAYAHVRDGTPYPAVLFSTGANDPRVSPWQMGKMAARVQGATSSGKPALLRIDYDAGHGLGSSSAQRENQIADLWSFALWQMGDPAFQPAAQ
ncbi:MAG TPA: prolyl oligopeptidase family serine peptidase [Burkholderiaceae bacterium]